MNKIGPKYYVFFNLIVYEILIIVTLLKIINISILGIISIIFISIIIAYYIGCRFIYYILLDNNKILKVNPLKVKRKIQEINVLDISFVEVKYLHAPPSIIWYNYKGNKIFDISNTKEDLNLLLKFLISHNVNINVNVRKDFVDYIKIIKKITKGYGNIKW